MDNRASELGELLLNSPLHQYTAELWVSLRCHGVHSLAHKGKYPLETDYLAAFLIGLFGTLHCVSMCGSIIGVLTLSLARETRLQPPRFMSYLLLYSIGRLLSYTIAGALAGAFGSGLLYRISPQSGHQILLFIATALMVAVGFYLAGWFPKLAYIERLGTPVWQRLDPLGRKLLPVKSRLQALLYGMIWGWLPCGLVYSALFIALAHGNYVTGGVFMFVFGLGTLPAVIGTGIFADRLIFWARNPQVRMYAGIVLILLALWGLFINW